MVQQANRNLVSGCNRCRLFVVAPGAAKQTRAGARRTARVEPAKRVLELQPAIGAPREEGSDAYLFDVTKGRGRVRGWNSELTEAGRGVTSEGPLKVSRPALLRELSPGTGRAPRSTRRQIRPASWSVAFAGNLQGVAVYSRRLSGDIIDRTNRRLLLWPQVAKYAT